MPPPPITNATAPSDWQSHTPPVVAVIPWLALRCVATEHNSVDDFIEDARTRGLAEFANGLPYAAIAAVFVSATFGLPLLLEAIRRRQPEAGRRKLEGLLHGPRVWRAVLCTVFPWLVEASVGKAIVGEDVAVASVALTVIVPMLALLAFLLVRAPGGLCAGGQENGSVWTSPGTDIAGGTMAVGSWQDAVRASALDGLRGGSTWAAKWPLVEMVTTAIAAVAVGATAACPPSCAAPLESTCFALEWTCLLLTCIVALAYVGAVRPFFSPWEQRVELVVLLLELLLVVLFPAAAGTPLWEGVAYTLLCVLAARWVARWVVELRSRAKARWVVTASQSKEVAALVPSGAEPKSVAGHNANGTGAYDSTSDACALRESSGVPALGDRLGNDPTSNCSEVQNPLYAGSGLQRSREGGGVVLAEPGIAAVSASEHGSILLDVEDAQSVWDASIGAMCSSRLTAGGSTSGVSVRSELAHLQGELLEMAICMDSLEGASTSVREQAMDVAGDVYRADVLHSLDDDGAIAARLRAAGSRLHALAREEGLEDELSLARQRLQSTPIGGESGGGRSRALSGLLQHIRARLRRTDRHMTIEQINPMFSTRQG